MMQLFKVFGISTLIAIVLIIGVRVLDGDNNRLGVIQLGQIQNFDDGH